MRDITEQMNTYRECARNLWNVHFSREENIGWALDSWDELRRLLFQSLVADQLLYEEENEAEPTPPHLLPPPLLKVVPWVRTMILIPTLSGPGEATYWGQEKDLFVGPDDIELEFVEYFDFHQVPIKDFRYFRCRIVRFPGHPEYVGRDSLIDALDGRVFHDEEGEAELRRKAEAGPSASQNPAAEI